MLFKDKLFFVGSAKEKVSKNSTSKRIKVYLDKGAYMPVKAHESDAGYDLKTPFGFTIEGGKSVSVNTGIHVQIPDGYVGFIKSKSGLNVKHDLITEGVIDSGYTGSIVVKMHSLSNHSHVFEKGDKVTQLVILPIGDFQLVETKMPLEMTSRGDCGFGSTGR